MKNEKELQEVCTWEGACKILNRDASKVPDYSMIEDEAERNYNIAGFKLPIHIEAMNKVADATFKVDFGSWSQKKWLPIPVQEADDTQPTGFGLSLDDVRFTYSYTGVSARLCYCDEETARFGFENLKQLYIHHQLKF